MVVVRLAKYTRSVSPYLRRRYYSMTPSGSSVALPHQIPNDWHTTATSQYMKVPSEHDILHRDLCIVTGGIIPDDEFTGANIPALAYAAANALSIDEIPEITFYSKGDFNSLFRLDFVHHDRKLLARVPLRIRYQNAFQIESTVATMSFARHIRGIPTPRIVAWNPSKDSPVGAPYILQEYVDNVIEPWRRWRAWSDEQRSQIIYDLARIHATLLEPLPAPLQDVGNLAFAPGLSAVADLADPASYIVKPLQLRHLWASIEWRRMEPFIASTSTLHRLWEELWSHHRSRSICGSDIDREVLDLSDDNDDGSEDEHCDLASFTAVADNVRIVAEDALRMLAQFPQYAQPCLVNYDYAYRNILLDSDTLRVKALIDWDDVHVMPFIVGIDFPEDITQFSTYGLAPDSNYYREGIFPSFPPDEYGEIIGAVDADGKFAGQAEQGNSIDVDQRNQRIRDTMSRETYIRALQSQDGRVSQPDMWEVRRKVLKAHHLLAEGGWMWWSKREWLQMQASGIGEDTATMNVCR